MPLKFQNDRTSGYREKAILLNHSEGSWVLIKNMRPHQDEGKHTQLSSSILFERSVTVVPKLCIPPER